MLLLRYMFFSQIIERIRKDLVLFISHALMAKGGECFQNELIFSKGFHKMRKNTVMIAVIHTL